MQKKVPNQHIPGGHQAEEGVYVLRLFITGATPNSLKAVTNVTAICETYLKDSYTLEIIDVYQDAEIAQQEELIALPMLVKKMPLPERRFIGDLSNTEKVLDGLGIAS